MPLRNRGPMLMNGPFQVGTSGRSKAPRCNCDRCVNRRIERRIARATARLEQQDQEVILEPPGYEDVLSGYREISARPSPAELFNDGDEYSDYLESPEAQFDRFLNAGQRMPRKRYPDEDD